MTARRRSTTGAQTELARLLVELRGARNQTDAAELGGITQAKISRAERDLFPLDPEEAGQYADALGATPKQRRQLVELCDAAAADRSPRTSLVRRAVAIQEKIRGLVDTSTRIRGWQDRMILGTLQTHDYTQAMLDGDGEGDPGQAWWTARLARVALMDEPSRQWHQVMSEAALRWGIGSPHIMAAQIDHLAAVSWREHVRVGIVPLDALRPSAPPEAFTLYDGAEPTVEVGSRLGAVFPSGPQDLQLYEGEFARLEGLAVYDDDARELLVRAKDRWT